MTNIKGSIFNTYCWLAELSFYLFLFGTLSFGRSFSALHVNTPLSPLFVTEIFLLLNIPVLVYKYKSLAKLPKIFLSILLIFFSFSCYYLCVGILRRNMFALRDITLSLYMLFLPITLIHLNSLNRIKVFIGVIILSNLISLYSGWCVLRNVYFSEAFYNFIAKGSFTCWGLYYGITISFIVSYCEFIKPRVYRLFVLIILSLNLYMVVVISQRSLWLATLLLFVFFLLVRKSKFLKFLSFFILIPVLMSSILFYFDSKAATTFNTRVIFNKAKGFSLFLQGVPYLYQPSAAKEPPEVAALGNITWRFNIWNQTLKFGLESPLIGKGFGVYPDYEIWRGFHQSPQGIYLNSRIVPAHNHLLTVFFKMGILGLALFLFMNIYVFVYALAYVNKCSLEFIKNLLTALLGTFIFWHILALFFDMIDSPPTSIFLWIIMGLIFSAIEIDKNSLTNFHEKVDTGKSQ